MIRVSTCELPVDALLRRYRDAGAYTDCYCADVARAVSHAEYLEAFYDSGLFRIERRILAWFLAKPSTDEQTQALAAGTLDAYAAWTVEERRPDQLLMCDFMGRTRSWLMSAPDADGRTTRLYFGSAVTPVSGGRSGKASMGWPFRALLGFHLLYSRLLLRAAARRLG